MNHFTPVSKFHLAFANLYQMQGACKHLLNATLIHLILEKPDDTFSTNNCKQILIPFTAFCEIEPGSSGF